MGSVVHRRQSILPTGDSQVADSDKVFRFSLRSFAWHVGKFDGLLLPETQLTSYYKAPSRNLADLLEASHLCEPKAVRLTVVLDGSF